MFNLASAPRASDWQNFGNEIVRINKELQQTKQRKRIKQSQRVLVATVLLLNVYSKLSHYH